MMAPQTPGKRRFCYDCPWFRPQDGRERDMRHRPLVSQQPLPAPTPAVLRMLQSMEVEELSYSEYTFLHVSNPEKRYLLLNSGADLTKIVL